MPLFRTGTLTLAPGAETFAATGLDLPFTPAWVGLTVRRPSADAPALSVFLAGAPTSDGFQGDLSAPVPGEGYLLDWAAYPAEYAAADTGTASLGYADLLAAVARYLGYDPSALSESEAAECDAHVQSGVRQFYWPPVLEGQPASHVWSFLRATGAVTALAGQGEAALPAGFGRVIGDEIRILSPDGQAVLGLAREAPETALRENLRRHPEPGPPRLFAPLWNAALGPNGQTGRLLLWPVPDKNYSLRLDIEGDCGRLDATYRPHPLGGAQYGECILESCLAVAEQRSNDEAGIHTRLYREALAAAIQRDRRHFAGTLGPINRFPHPADGPTVRPSDRQTVRPFTVTYKGETW